MNKIDLIEDLKLQYKFVDVPQAQESTSIITYYVVTVFEVGESEQNKKPIANQKNIFFYVYNEGQTDEVAFYARTEPVNTSNTDVSTDDSYFGYSNIFKSTILRDKCLAGLMKQCVVVMKEDTIIENHTNRIKLVIKINNSLEEFINIFMSVLCSNNDVLINGATVGDEIIANLIVENWNMIANLYA